MGRRKSNTLQEEDTLAEEVRKYPCLYDKSEEGYKDRTKNRNAWNAVDQALGAEKGTFFYYFLLLFFYDSRADLSLMQRPTSHRKLQLGIIITL